MAIEKQTVPERLKALGALYEERNKLYGSNYLEFGHVLSAMFPNGITLQTPEQFNRFALFVQISHKITRYAKAMPDGGHVDSLNDLSVYSMMLQENDAICQEQQKVPWRSISS